MVGRPIARSRRIAAAATLLLSAAAAVTAAARVAAVTTVGSGTLTICRDWLVYDSCTPYHHVGLPKRIALGDRLKVVFGSNPKEYVFHVIAIHRHGGACTLLNRHTGAHESGEKIVVAPCQPAPPQSALAR